MPKLDLDVIKGPVVLLKRSDGGGQKICTVVGREDDLLKVFITNGLYFAQLDAEGRFHPLYDAGGTRVPQNHAHVPYDVAWQGTLPFKLDGYSYQRALEFITATVEGQGIDWDAEPASAPGLK